MMNNVLPYPKRVKIPAGHAIALVLALGLSGCAAARINLIDDRVVQLHIVPSKTHDLEKVSIVQEGNELLVYGKVRQRQGFCLSVGHIDLAIVGPDGRVLMATSLPYVDRGQRRRGWMGAHFRVRLGMVPPRSSTVRLAFDGEDCHPGTTFDAGTNRAVPGNEKPAR